jgi:DNA-binding MarR family transcriptional regulator
MAGRGTPDAVLVASRALVGVAARSLAETEDTITLVQYRALVLLAARGEMNVGTLAEALAVHQSTATRLCDRLVKRGLVERSAAPQSRREVVVSLTRAGLTLLRSVTTKRRAEIDEILKRLNAKQRAAVTDAFLLFADAAGEAPDDAWKLGWTT